MGISRRLFLAAQRKRGCPGGRRGGLHLLGKFGIVKQRAESEKEQKERLCSFFTLMQRSVKDHERRLRVQLVRLFPPRTKAGGTRVR